MLVTVSWMVNSQHKPQLIKRPSFVPHSSWSVFNMFSMLFAGQQLVWLRISVLRIVLQRRLVSADPDVVDNLDDPAILEV